MLYSEAEAIKPAIAAEGKPVPGSVMFVPAVAGLMLAGKVIMPAARPERTAAG